MKEHNCSFLVLKSKIATYYRLVTMLAFLMKG